MNRCFVRCTRSSLAFLRRPRLRLSRLALGSGPLGSGPLGVGGALQPSSLANLNPGQFQTELTALEGAVQKLRQHFDHICQNQQQQQALHQRLAHPHLPVEELQAIHQQLETLEVELASATLPWQRLAEPFWQAVRFGGLGLVLGWLLKGVCQGQ